MKRQSGVVRDPETQPREKSERKKARLGHQNDEQNELSAMKQNNLSSENVDFPFEHLNVQFSDVKTSTPINLNGFKNGNADPTSIPSTSRPDFIPNSFDDCSTENVLPDLDMYGNGILETPPSEDPSNGQPMMPNVVDNFEIPVLEKLPNINEIVSGEGDTAQKEPKENGDKTNSEVQKAVEDTMKDPSSKCDVDNFVTSLMQVSVLNGHAEEVLAVAADEEVILSSSRDTTIKMWDACKREELCNFQGHTHAVNTLKLLTAEQSALLSAKLGFTEVHKIVISGSTDCSIRLWAVPLGVELLSIYTYNGITCLDYKPDSNCVVLGTDGGKLEVWDLCTAKVLHSVLAHEDSITGLKVDENYIYTTSADGLVKVWLLDDDDDLQVIYTRRRMVPLLQSDTLKPCRWTCLASHEKSMYLGDNSPNIKVLDWNEGRLRMVKDRTETEGFITALHSKQNILLSAVYDSEADAGAIQVWQLPSLTYVCTMFGDAGKVSSLSLTETEGGILRIVSGGTKLLVWDFICSKPAAEASKDDSFFCQELKQTGEDELTMYIDMPSPSTIKTSSVSHSDKDSKPASSRRCLIM